MKTSIGRMITVNDRTWVGGESPLFFDLSEYVNTGFCSSFMILGPEDVAKSIIHEILNYDDRGLSLDYIGEAPGPVNPEEVYAMLAVVQRRTQDDKMIHRKVLLPLSLPAILNTFNETIPLEFVNALYKDVEISSDSTPFAVGKFFKTIDGRIIEVKKMNSNMSSTSYWTFMDQYGHHRYSAQAGSVGRVTGCKIDYPGNILPFDRPRPAC